MKLSFWDIMASMVMLAGLALATIFINIFINPYSFINPFPPPTPIATLDVPTLTPSPRSLPELWTMTPGLSGTPEANGTPTITSTGFTSTASVTGTGVVLPTKTTTPTPSKTVSILKTITKTPNKTLTSYYYKTATIAPTKTATSASGDTTPPTTPGNPYSTSSASDPNPIFSWAASSDSGGSGLKGYHVTWGLDSGGNNTMYAGTPTTFISPTLTVNGIYYFYVRAVDNAGNESPWAGPARFGFTGAGGASVITYAASSINSTSAVLNGTINANGNDTSAYFEYGTSTSYGTPVIASPALVTGSSTTAVTYSLTGLAPNTTYHFRVYGINAFGRANGQDRIFTTTKLASTTTIGTIAPDPSAVGQPYSVPVTVTGSGATPTGQVNVSDGSATCSFTLAAGTGSCNLTSTTAGAKTITASYVGDSNYAASSTTTSHTVDKATPTVSLWPTASGIAYGQALSSSTLTPVNAVVGTNASVAGTFAFTSPATVPGSVGTYSASVTFTPTNSANYNTVTGSVNVVVSLATPTITFGTAPTPTYSAAGTFTVSATTTNTDSGTLTYSVSSGTACSYSGAGGVFDIVSAGACQVRADGAASANFNAAYATQNITIAKAAATITFGAAPTPIFSPGGTFTVSASTDNTDDPSLTYSAVSGPCTLNSGSTFDISGAGTCVVRAQGAASTNFNAASDTQSVTIAKADQTITFTGPGTGSVGGNASLSATASSGLTVVFSSTTTGVCTVSGTTVTYVTTGTCTIAADQGGNADYESAPQVTDNIVVS